MLASNILFNKKITTINTSSYPITINDIKLKSEYFNLNSTDTSLDNYIQNIVIPNIIRNWEFETKYFILDQRLVNYLNFIDKYLYFYINGNDFLSLNALNVRQINSIKYYPCDWDNIAPKTTLDNNFYYFTPELLANPMKFKIKDDNSILRLYKIENNFEIDFNAGFLNNNFSTLNPEIKDCLAMQGATVIDRKQGFCSGAYDAIIADCYDKFGINKIGFELV